MRPKDIQRASEINKHLEADIQWLPGIRARRQRDAFIEQLVESIRRVEYISKLREIDLSLAYADPSTELFDPIKAAVIHQNAGRIEEACWLVFLSVHFGKHRKARWETTKQIYGRLGTPPFWTWDAVKVDSGKFRQWLADNQEKIQRRIGNHRKYISLDAIGAKGTGAAIQSYVELIESGGGHAMFFENAIALAGGNSRLAFDYLYRTMSCVVSFGRTGKFDYLCMLSKLKITEIRPGSTYMTGATGPYFGAKLMFGSKDGAEISRRKADECAVRLSKILNVGVDVLEDALCNWQKSPKNFKAFRG